MCLKIHQNRLYASDNRSPTMTTQDSLSKRFHFLEIFFLSIRPATTFVVSEGLCKGLLISAGGYISYGTEQTNQRYIHSRFYFPICEMHIGLHIPVKENIKTIHYLQKTAEWQHGEKGVSCWQGCLLNRNLPQSVLPVLNKSRRVNYVCVCIRLVRCSSQALVQGRKWDSHIQLFCNILPPSARCLSLPCPQATVQPSVSHLRDMWLSWTHEGNLVKFLWRRTDQIDSDPQKKFLFCGIHDNLSHFMRSSTYMEKNTHTLQPLLVHMHL